MASTLRKKPISFCKLNCLFPTLKFGHRAKTCFYLNGKSKGVFSFPTFPAG